MSTPDPISSSELDRRLAVIEAENRANRESRHAANARISEIIDTQRMSHMDLEKTVEQIAVSVTQLTEAQRKTQAQVDQLVDAIRGNDLGHVGFIQRVKNIDESLQAARRESREYRERNDERFLKLEAQIANAKSEVSGAWKLAVGVSGALGFAATALAVFRG